eukprot:CAMPEP_0173279294 /NCGR_PEP_ID=MMETSP1143-20121109/5074_1 /TAXON_ID=483371 /ORGANISM="non described non described, Strain CCMP2298" /LENGTH=51 /DNA_ID=CAMNT_0014216517 /DNA_START=189 /DNA_END=344 /DNA_ORIENTATION=+
MLLSAKTFLCICAVLSSPRAASCVTKWAQVCSGMRKEAMLQLTICDSRDSR